jgi:predicted nuclease of predicted toxin-antitoxin system
VLARFYADEQFPRRVVELLREMGHDVLTVQEAERRGDSDAEVLAFATSDDRAVITLNRKDFFKLHRIDQEHSGIIACTDDQDRERLANNIHDAIKGLESLAGLEIRVRKPG